MGHPSREQAEAGAAVRIRVERAFGDAAGLGGTYVLGHAGADTVEQLLAPVAAEPGAVVESARETLVRLPPDLPPAAAILVPVVAEALRAWDLTNPELGTTAIVTGASPWSALMHTVAAWYGAWPALLGRSLDGEPRSTADGGSLGALTRALAEAPAVCAMELTGRSDMVDLLLEAVPRYSSVLFAGPRADRLTIDYYVNVHRKGLNLSSTVLSPLRLFRSTTANDVLALRACRFLMNPRYSSACAESLVPAIVSRPLES